MVSGRFMRFHGGFGGFVEVSAVSGRFMRFLRFHGGFGGFVEVSVVSRMILKFRGSF